jgi:hypothetical protein
LFGKRMPGTEDKEQSTKNKAPNTKVLKQQRKWMAYALLLVTAFSFRLSVALYLANDIPEDARVYAQMARNLLEQHVYSHAKAPPYQPSLIRLPGYSIFLAAIYYVFGHWNNTAVRIVQALLDTLTCALVAMIAYYWEPDENRKRAASLSAFALAAVCPFTTIYVATVLTETWASLFAVALALLATKAFSVTREPPRDSLAGPAANFRRSLWWWAATGLIAGTSVFFRPDSGLFVAAVGLTLVFTALIRQRGGDERQSWRRVLFQTITQGAVLSVAFAVVLVPWTIRNWREFHLFQPLSPTHGEMPGEFVPRGYQAWLRTWVDDRKYTDSMLWSLDESEIDIDELPAAAFDSPEERARVAALIERYNDPPDEDDNLQSDQPEPSASPTQGSAADSPVTREQTPSPEANDQAQSEPDVPQAETAPPEEEPPPDMTPELDAAFGQIARERIARAPLRYYLWLPLKRARSLWFGSHSDYYPFAGELFPLDDLDHSTHQQIWLPLFALLVWIYTLLGILGGCRLWCSPQSASRRWLTLAVLIIFLRLAFFSTMENPEPRYTVEIFPLLAILGGIAISWLRKVRVT